jgi:hypothetical protein
MDHVITKEDLQSLQKQFQEEILNYEKEVVVKRSRLQKLNALLDTYNEPALSQGITTGYPFTSVTTTRNVPDFEIVRRTLLKTPESFTADEAFKAYCDIGRPGELTRATFMTIVRKLAFGEKALLKSSSPGRGKSATYCKGESFGLWAKDFTQSGA